jgi:ATPase family associated with various cellular activities (AAA)
MKWGQRGREQLSNDKTESRSSLWGKVLQSGEILGPVAMTAILARGRLRLRDYIAIGASTVNAGLKLWDIWSIEEPINLAKAFDYEGSPWRLCPYFICQHAFESMEIAEKMLDKYKVTKGGKVISAAWTATVDGIEIGWTGSPHQAVVPETIWSTKPQEIRLIAARRLWEKAGSDRVLRIVGEKTMPVFLPQAVVETEFLQMVEVRARKFLDHQTPRAMIMDGEPGTGKTTAAAHLARHFDFQTVVMSVEDFIRSESPNGGRASGLELARLLAPDILIINDIDRLRPEYQLNLLDLLDAAKSFARLVFVTTNHYRALIEPVRRPGRLDDLLLVPGLSIKEIEMIAPKLKQIAGRMLGWPIAYVRDMADRYDVLGEEALAEFDDVQRRLNEVREDGGYRAPPRGGQGRPFTDSWEKRVKNGSADAPFEAGL